VQRQFLHYLDSYYPLLHRRSTNPVISTWYSFLFPSSHLIRDDNEQLGNNVGEQGYFFISALFLGYSDSGFNTQIYAMLGSYFPKQSEPAFAGTSPFSFEFLSCVIGIYLLTKIIKAFKLLQAMSTSVSFFYSIKITYPYLVLICSFFLLLGIIFLGVLDIFVNPIDANLKKRTYMTDSDYAVSDTDVGEN
jgi:hypothetical protein